MSETPAGDRPVRPTRRAAAPAQGAAREDGAAPSERRRGWTEIVEVTMALDVEAAHSELLRKLRLGDSRTGSQVLAALDEVQENTLLAKRLAERARLDYELEKEAHDLWLEERKSGALIALEAEKKAKDLKKQITIDMVLDQVRATWPREYLARVESLKRFGAAVHVLEELVELWRDRSRSLNKMADILLATGAAPRGR